MSEYAILLNGELSEMDSIRSYLTKVEHYIAADGGARHALRYNLPIATLIGDFDSIAAELLNQYRAQGVEIIEHPIEKDATDLELAVRLAHERGAESIHLLGTEGGRSDHLLGMMTLLGHSDFAACRLWAYDAEHRITALHAGQDLKIESTPGARLSIIPLTASVEGISLTGTRWELKRSTLRLGQSMALSNEVVVSKVELSVESGVAVVMLQLN